MAHDLTVCATEPTTLGAADILLTYPNAGGPIHGNSGASVPQPEARSRQTTEEVMSIGAILLIVIVLMLVGVALSAVIWRLQAYLLRWQQHNMAE